MIKFSNELWSLSLPVVNNWRNHASWLNPLVQADALVHLKSSWMIRSRAGYLIQKVLIRAGFKKRDGQTRLSEG